MATVDDRGVRGLARRANPAFAGAAVTVPILALAAANASGSLRALFYVHVMAGALWTGVDVFMGGVVGPVVGGLDRDEKASVFARLTPKMTFLMPILAAVTITAGVQLAGEMGYFASEPTWVLVAGVVAGLLTVVGFGIILPGEIAIYRELVSEAPDVDRIGAIGMRNAKLGALQGALQLGIIFVMVNFRL